MKKNELKTDTAPADECYIPDFCHSENNFVLILVLELIAIVMTLSAAPGPSNLFIYLALISMYIQWIGLSSAALLCLLGRFKLLNSTKKATLISLLVVALVTVLMAMVAYYLNGMLRLDLFKSQSLLVAIIHHVSISFILYGLALRYFYVQYSSRQMIKAESQARLQALQARIRPHFLFNSLNTIASLTHDEPDKAERAIEDLADLFRASLKGDTQISLQDEIELTQDYINLELLRLDERLQVNWDIQSGLDELSLPALLLQPLVENAIYHGIEPLKDGGTVNILIHKDQGLLIEISNPWNKPGASRRRQGNQMALKNITERLLLAYQGEAKIMHLVENDLYKVKISIPITKN